MIEEDIPPMVYRIVETSYASGRNVYVVQYAFVYGPEKPLKWKSERAFSFLKEAQNYIADNTVVSEQIIPLEQR